MKQERKTLQKLLSLTHEIELLEQRLQEEKRVASVYGMFGRIHPPQELRKIKSNIEKLKEQYNQLKETL